MAPIRKWRQEMSSIVDCDDQPLAPEAVNRGGRAGELPGLERWRATALRNACKSFFAWRHYRETLHELGKPDDHTLQDIGLTRADLPAGASAGDLRGIAELLTPVRGAGRDTWFAVARGW